MMILISTVEIENCLTETGSVYNALRNPMTLTIALPGIDDTRSIKSECKQYELYYKSPTLFETTEYGVEDSAA